MKAWMWYRKQIINNRIHTDFLHKCINNNIVPPHIGNIFNKYRGYFTHERSIKSFELLKQLFVKKLLRIELNDKYGSTRFAHTQIFKLSRNINCYIPLSVCNSFFNRQNGPLYTYFVNERNKLNKKFEFLYSK